MELRREGKKRREVLETWGKKRSVNFLDRISKSDSRV
jgi:hypothetical protein